MCLVRKLRSSYTVEEDVIALRMITASSSGIFSGGSAGAKLQKWVAVADLMTAQGVDVTGDGLRRHVADLVKKHKRQGPKPHGMPWPKSDEEVERDRLIEEYIARLEESKKPDTPVIRPAAKTARSKKPMQAPRVAPAQLQTGQSPVAQGAMTVRKTPLTVSTPPRNVPTSSVQEVAVASKPSASKRKHPEPVSIEAGGDDFGIWLPETPPNKSTSSNEATKLNLKRRRLEMEERTQNRMLDIQAEQIKLQREQLRLQADTMRAMVEATNTIAHVLQALQRRLP